MVAANYGSGCSFWPTAGYGSFVTVSRVRQTGYVLFRVSAFSCASGRAGGIDERALPSCMPTRYVFSAN